MEPQEAQGSGSSLDTLQCGRGNYCPDGSAAPTPCPFQMPPSGGWGALQVQGPAFLHGTISQSLLLEFYVRRQHETE